MGRYSRIFEYLNNLNVSTFDNVRFCTEEEIVCKPLNLKFYSKFLIFNPEARKFGIKLTQLNFKVSVVEPIFFPNVCKVCKCLQSLQMFANNFVQTCIPCKKFENFCQIWKINIWEQIWVLTTSYVFVWQWAMQNFSNFEHAWQSSQVQIFEHSNRLETTNWASATNFYKFFIYWSKVYVRTSW